MVLLIGISNVNQIIKEQPSTFLSPTEFESKYHTKVCPLTFYGITSTLRELWKNQKPNISLNSKEQKGFTTAFLKSEKPSRLAYQKLVETIKVPVRRNKKLITFPLSVVKCKNSKEK